MNFFSDLVNLFLPSKKGHVKTETMLVIRNRRIFARYISLLIACIGILFVNEQRAFQIFIGFFLVGIPGIFFLLFSDLTVTADRTQKTLTLQYRSILHRRTRIVPFSDILRIDIQSYDSTSTTKYMLVVDTVKGSIPFRFFYSSSLSSMAADAVELAEFIGVGKKSTG